MTAARAGRCENATLLLPLSPSPAPAVRRVCGPSRGRADAVPPPLPQEMGQESSAALSGTGGNRPRREAPASLGSAPAQGLGHGASLPWGPRSLPAKWPRGAPAPLRPLPALRCRLPGRGVLFAVRLMSEPHSGRFPDGGERVGSGRPTEASLPPLPPPPARRCRGLALGGGTGKSWFQFAL